MYREYKDMLHGWTVRYAIYLIVSHVATLSNIAPIRGDIRREDINNAARAAFNSMLGFLNTYLK